MGHMADYSVSKITFEKNNKFVFEVVANWKNKTEVVQKLYEEGNCKERYLVNSNMCGIVTCFPGDTLGYYYGNTRERIRAWSDLKKINKPYQIANWGDKKEEQLTKIVEKRPELKYFIQKLLKSNQNISIYEFTKLLNVYKEHPQIEGLVEKGMFTIACDKRLFKLSKKKMCEVINFIKNNEIESKHQNLNYIFWKMKNKELNEQIYDLIIREKLDLESAKYLVKTKQTVHSYSYKDYLKIAKDCGHDITNEYWKFPKDIMKAHKKVSQELNLIQKAKEEKKQLEKQSLFNKVAKKYIHDKFQINGYEVYVPQSIRDICNQADVLHQCLVRCDYISKMSKGNCILVFVKKENKPISTFELDNKLKIVQHYTDESDYKNCNPTEELKAVANSFIELLRHQHERISKTSQQKLCLAVA